MTAIVYNIRDYQSAKDRERIARMAREILDQIDTAPCELVPYSGSGLDGMTFTAPDSDPA